MCFVPGCLGTGVTMSPCCSLPCQRVSPGVFLSHGVSLCCCQQIDNDAIHVHTVRSTHLSTILAYSYLHGTYRLSTAFILDNLASTFVVLCHQMYWIIIDMLDFIVFHNFKIYSFKLTKSHSVECIMLVVKLVLLSFKYV